MNKPFKLAAVGLCVAVTLGLAATAVAQQAPKPEQQIKWRQSAFQVVAWNVGRIKANVDGSYNKDEVVRAANVVSAVANSSLSSLFAAGTETGKGWHDTAAKPEVFKDSARFGELFGNFRHEADQLASVAASGDVGAIKEQLGKVQHTCKSCHDDYKSKE